MKKVICVAMLLLGLSILTTSCEKIGGNDSLAGLWSPVDYELNLNGNPQPKTAESDDWFKHWEYEKLRFYDDGRTGAFLGDFTYTIKGNIITFANHGNLEGLTMTILGDRLKSNGWISTVINGEDVYLDLIFKKL